jgi:hypothetical protein
MEENIKTRNGFTEENREVALGICFGTGIGIVAGAVLGNVAFGLSAGGVIGIIAGVIVGGLKKFRKA